MQYPRLAVPEAPAGRSLPAFLPGAEGAVNLALTEAIDRQLFDGDEPVFSTFCIWASRTPRRPFAFSLFALVLLGLLPAAWAAAAPAARNVKCLLEVNGVHYLGGICKFVAVDRQGSFRISDQRGLGLIAQVMVRQKDEGEAFWNGPLGKGPAADLGAASRIKGGCWSAGDSNPARICAWSLTSDVYLGPSPPPPDPISTLFWGSRVGMYDDIASRQGIDSAHAVIKLAPSRNGVIDFCRNYDLDYSNKCIEDGLRNDHPKTVVADCPAKTFTDFDDVTFQFIGPNKNPSGAVGADYLVKNLKSGAILDGSSASGYDIELGILKALCPALAPRQG